MDKQYSIQFFTKFVEAMQKFCRDYIEFEQAVELSGYLSLEIDNYKKERYILSEMVHDTGDVISESYCVKAFKTMKRLPPKSESILRDSVNVRAAGVASSRDITIDLRHSPEPRSPHRNVPQSSARHRTSNSYRSVSGLSQSSSYHHNVSGQMSTPSMSPSSKRTHNLSFAAGSQNQVEKQSNMFNSPYEPHTSEQNQQVLEIQPRHSVHISSGQGDSLAGSNTDSETNNFASLQNNEQTSEPTKGQKRSIPVSEEAPYAKKDKSDGDLDSLISAATSIVPVSEPDTNTLKTMYDSEKQISNDSVTSDNPSASTPGESIRLPLPGNIHIKEEVDDVVLMDSPDNLGDNSDLAQLEVSFGVAGQAWNAEMKASQQPKFSQNVHTKYHQYDQDALTEACVAVKEDGISFTKAAMIFCVPQTMLRKQLTGAVSIDKLKPGPSNLFSKEQDKRLANHITLMTRMGYVFNHSELCNLGKEFAVELGLRNDDKTRLSLKWYRNFTIRWPHIAIKKPVHEKVATPENLNAYFEELDKILSQYNLKNKAHNIYYVTEKCLYTADKSAVDDDKSSASISIFGAGSASGNILPAYFVFQGKQFRTELLKGVIAGISGTVIDSGWLEERALKQYIKEHFMKHIKSHDPSSPLMILLKGHRNHLSLGIMEWAKKQNVILFIHPPNPNQWKLPADIGCFELFEETVKKLKAEYMKGHSSSAVPTNVLCEIGSSACSCCLTPANLNSSFQKWGICPFIQSAAVKSQPIVLKLRSSSPNGRQNPDESSSCNFTI